MSNSLLPGLFSTVIFNPALLSKEDLVRGFVARQDLLDRLLDDLRRAEPTSPPQHQLLIGQRGLGKTTLLRRLAFAIEDDSQLKTIWLPLVFPEEQYNIRRLGDFWLNCVDALSDALDRDGDKEAAARLDRKVENIPVDPTHHASAALSILVEEADRLERRLVLLIDNIDVVFDRISEEEEWAFRRVVSSVPEIYLIGASSRALETLYEHGRAFYDYFQVHDLKGLNDAEMFTLMTRLAAEADDTRVLKLLKEQPARLRALRVLTGGNPRTMVLLYRILAEGPHGDVQRDLEQLLDIYTPVYKARFEEMSPQAQQVVDAMALHWDPLTAAELTSKLAPFEVNQISAQLKRLEDYGIVEKAPWFGESKAAFQIAERFFNIWYLMRASRRVRRRLIWLVRFLEACFEREEVAAHASSFLERGPLAVGASRFAEATLAYAQVVDNNLLRRNLEFAGLKAALDASARDLLDFCDLPADLQDRKHHMEQMAALRAVVLAQRMEGVDSQELWLLLGGSPQLSFEEKQQAVLDLPSKDQAEISALLNNLRSARLFLEQANLPATAALYEILQDGEIRDVYDVEGSLAAAHRLQVPALPFVSLMSRTSVESQPERMSSQELAVAEAAWRRLASLEPAFTFVAAFELGDIYELRRNNVDEAERLYREATVLRPDFTPAFDRLASLLENLGRHDEAEQAIRQASQATPENPVLWSRLGRLLMRDSTRLDEAEQAFRSAVSIDPQSSYAWERLGLLADKAGRRHEAEQAFRSAIAINDESLLAWSGLGLLLVGTQPKRSEAESAARRVIELAPAEPLGWMTLAYVLSQDASRQVEEACALLRLAQLSPADESIKTAALRSVRGVMAQSEGEQQALLEALEKLSSVLPRDSEVSFALAGIYARSKQWPQAKTLLAQLDRDGVDPDIGTFKSIVDAGYLGEVLASFDESEGRDRWRPLYEALRAIQAGSRQYLRRVAPEVRIAAESLLNQLAPGFAAKAPTTKRKRKFPH